MTEKLISIVVPVYNVAQYLPICLDSILAQTYRNLEIIVINDGSTDDSGNICDAYAKKDTRIKVFHQSNRGLSAARNIGLAYASGEYVGFVDSDDRISSDMYQALYTVLIDYDADVVCCGQYMVIDNDVYAPKRCTGKIELLTAKKIISKLLISDVTTSVCNKLYKREILSRSPFLEGVFYEDLHAMPDILLRCRCVALMRTPYYYYTTTREGSICNSFSVKHMKDLFDACVFRNERIKEHYPDLTKFTGVSQMVYDTVIYSRIVHKMKYDSGLSVLGEQIRKDIKQYPASYLLGMSVLRLPSALVLRYLPIGFGCYASVGQGVRRVVHKFKKVLRYEKVSQQ